MDPRLIISMLATVIGIASFVPYIKDILACRTAPHAYSYLLWTLTLATAAAGVLYGDGGMGAFFVLATWTVLMGGIFLLSLRYGTRHISRFDTVVLVSALAAIALWWIFDHPLLSVFLVAAIDCIAYLPTLLKSYRDPWSETLVAWVLYSIGTLLALLALEEYNLLTMTYLIAIALANTALIAVCAIRRRSIPRPAAACPP